MVGEQRRQAVGRGLVEMAAAAIGLGRIVEQHDSRAARPGCSRALPSSQHRTCWCRDGSSAPRSGSGATANSASATARPRVVEDRGAEQLRESSRHRARAAACAATASTLPPSISIGLSSGHSAWSCSVSARPSQNRPPCGTRLAALCAVSCAVFCARGGGLPGRGQLGQADVLVFVVVRPDAEIRLPLQIHQRRNRAHALARQARAAQSSPGRCRAARRRARGLWHDAQDSLPDDDRPASKNTALPSCAIADSGAAGGRTSRTGTGSRRSASRKLARPGARTQASSGNAAAHRQAGCHAARRRAAAPPVHQQTRWPPRMLSRSLSRVRAPPAAWPPTSPVAGSR